MRIVRKIIFGIICVLSLLIVWINFKLHADDFTNKEERADIILQLNFLEKELKNNDLGVRMQHLFPEGFVFTNSLYGLSWCEYGVSDPANSIKARALHEALFAYEQVNSAKGRSTFDASLQPENGIFYIGWNNYLLSKILLMDSGFTNNEKYRQIFSKQCESIADAVRESPTPYLQSYENHSWPADMCVAMASLSNYDKILTPKYKSVIDEWVKNARLKVDPETKMIAHKVNSLNGETIEGARGSSSSLILRLMAEIDLNFAKEQYKLYKQHFVSTTFGLPSVSEYPKGQRGEPSIDSGPMIFGVGFAGTIVSVGTFSILGDSELAEHQYKTINSFGMGYKTADTKKYVFGQLPVADAFIAWSRSSGLNHDQNSKQSSGYWTLKFHLISMFVIVVLWLLYYSRIIFSKLRKENE